MTSKKYLILDTNIVSNMMSASGQDAYLATLNNLLSEYRLIVTMFTQYELLKSSEADSQRAILEFLSKNYPRIELNESAMNFSARIFNLYKKHPSTKGLRITDGDIINAAITIGKDCYIMTIDNNDYPRPFFAEVARHDIRYSGRKGREVLDVAYILSPDMSNLKHCAKELKI